MRRAKRILALPAIFSALLLISGCSGKHMDRQGLGSSGSIAVVSVVLPRVADISQEPNRAVLQASVNRALERMHAGLAGVHSWKVLDPVKQRQGETVQAFGKATDQDLVALFPAPKTRTRVAGLMQQEQTRWAEGFIGADGLPIIPRRGLTGNDGGPPPDPALQHAMLQQAGKLCALLKVDAVAFVQLRADITHPRQTAFIVADGRTDGLLRMAATMVIVDKTGRIIADLGRPKLDDHARARDLLPLYRGAGKDSIKNENIDLGDSRKKIMQAFSALIDEAVADLLADLQAAAGK